MYTFIVARSITDIADPEHTLGIEITDPAVARACGLGNVDPQHGCGSRGWDIVDSEGLSRAPMAAIEQYYCCGSRQPEWLPPEGSTLATTRPDADSVGTMAVIVAERLATTNERFRAAWYRGGRVGRCDDVHGRIELIASADSFRVGQWAPSRLPTEESPWPTFAQAVDGTRSIAHLGAICSFRPGQPAMPLAERVAVMILWLLLGDDPTALLDGDVYDGICGACGVDVADYYVRLSTACREVEQSRLSLARDAQRSGAVEHVFAPHVCGLGNLAPVVDAAGTPRTACGECGELLDPVLAIVRVSHAGAMGLGYCVAPVVVAIDRANHGKVTIAEYNDTGARVDWVALRQALNDAELAAGGEPSWGGPRNLLGSPQRGGTRLTDDAVIGFVRAHITAR